MPRVASRISLRGGVYQYKRRIPADLKGHLALGSGEFHRASLRTANVNAARRAAIQIDEWIEALLADARGRSVPSPADADRLTPILSEAYLRGLQARRFDGSLSVDRATREAARRNPGSLEAEWQEREDQLDAMDWSSLHHSDDPAQAQELWRDRASDATRQQLDFEAAKFGLREGHPDWNRLKDALIEAERLALEGRLQRHAGAMTVEPSLHAVRDASKQATTPESTWSLSRLAEDYIQSRPLGADWQTKLRDKAKLFEQSLERPKAIGEVSRSDVRDFLALLRRTPARSATWFPGLGLRAAADANQRLERPRPTLDLGTIRDTHFAVIRRLFAYACGERDYIDTNPCESIKIDGGRKRRQKRPSFTTDELNAFFQLPIFTGCRSSAWPNTPGNYRLDDHRFWVPLLMLFTGARPAELAQLALSDVKLGGDHPHIGVLTEFDPNDPDDRPWVTSFKTANARRFLPIHPTLVDLGFPAYVERAQAFGPRLFPDWKRSPSVQKGYSQARWIRNINEDYLPSLTKRVPRPTFYSLRHTFKTRLAISRVPAQFQNALLGHAQVGMDEHYLDLDEIPVEELYSAISGISYPGVHLSHLKRGTEDN